MIKEFVQFIKRGNVIDLAVGVIIGAAFGKITSSLVADIITPLLSLFIGSIDLKNLFIALNGQFYDSLEAAMAAQAPTINYGIFITYIIDFFMTGITIFLFIKLITTVKEKALKIETHEEPEVVTTKTCEYCRTEIAMEATRCPNCTSILLIEEKVE